MVCSLEMIEHWNNSDVTSDVTSTLVHVYTVNVM